MNIKELKIEGFKSIGSGKDAVILKKPNPFSVFVGANASGKSNIFEALEFLELCGIMGANEALKYFGSFDEILNWMNQSDIKIYFDLGEIKPQIEISESDESSSYSGYSGGYNISSSNILGIGRLFPKDSDPSKIFEEAYRNPSFLQFSNFTRLFVGNSRLVKRPLKDDSRLNLDAGNLEKVLKRIFLNDNHYQDIVEILSLLIPGFRDIKIVSNQFSGKDDLLVYEKNIERPFTRDLISDGTYNIIAIVTALYQSDEPQFLCIEEPENGLNPKVVRELVEMIRLICKEKGHYIWLNTHSQSLISVLTPEEIIIVDKKNGLTQVKQIQGMNLHGLKMDEALLTNAIGGGIPW